MANDRFEYVDALRGLAILMVIVNHAGSIIGLSGSLRTISDLLSHGVQLFFVISAFTIFLTYSSRLRRGAKGAKFDFFVKRLFRIFPVYWFGIFVYTAFYGLESRGWLPGPELWHYFLHASLLNIWHPAAQSSVVPGGWSISVEVMFYLAVPFVFLLVRSFRSSLILLFVSVFLFPVLLLGVRKFLGLSFEGVSEADLYYWWKRNPFNQLACFACGIALFFAIKSGYQDKFKSLRSVVVLLLSALAVFVLASKLNSPFLQRHHLFSIAFSILAFSLSIFPTRFLVNDFFTFCGKISYSAYLLHFLVLKQLQDYFIFPANLIGFFEISILSIILVIPLAFLSHKTVEYWAIKVGEVLISFSADRRLRRNLA